jgi:hemolysin activation/secretion protein
MDLRKPWGGGTHIACALLTIAFGFDASAQQPGGALLPPAATPGGAQPFLGGDRIPALAQSGSLEIPPLIERPLGLEEGPRVRVANFNLLGAVDRPRSDITLAGIRTILDRHLAVQPPDGYTINQLQAIADDVTLYYRNRGVILAQAFVPAQDVENGVVALQVVEGGLGSVAVEGNRIYSSEAVLGPFEALLNQPIDRDSVEEALLTLQDYPGLTVFGTFREGDQLGDTELLVSVREEDRFSITPSFDNYGNEFTGDMRSMVQFQINNPVGVADRLSGYVLRTANPSNGTYGGLDYQVTTLNGKNVIGLGAAHNQFDVTDSSLGIDFGLEGTVKQANVFHRRRFANRRTFRADGTLDFARRDAVIDQSGQNPHDELLTLSYTFDYYAVGSRQRGINLGYFRAIGGDNKGALPSRVGAGGDVADGSYGKLEFGYQRLQRIGDHHALLLRLDGQHSSDLLVSLEQYVIGGPANVRAYPVAEALIDRGGSATLEWIIDAPGFADRPLGGRTWGDVFQLSFFVDYAGGEVNDPLPNQDRNVNLRGYGLGLQFSVSQKFYVRIDAATPDGDRLPSNGKDPQYYMSARFTF